MTNTNDNARDSEVSLWRNYNLGKVIYEDDDGTKIQLTPTQARARADSMEADIDNAPIQTQDDRDIIEQFIADLRSMADDVEETGNA